MHITFVKKIAADGQPCRKCRDVELRLERDGVLGHIDEAAIADERDADSRGAQLAREFGVDRAPFFLVRRGEQVEVYTIYLKFLREIIEPLRAAPAAKARSEVWPAAVATAG